MSRSDEVRTRILAAAAELFSKHGYAGVSIRDICAAAGVSPPTVYYHIGGKEELYRELVVESARQSSRRLAEAVAAGRSARERLAGYLYAFLDTARTWPFRHSVLTPEPSGAHLYRHPEVEKAVEEGRTLLIEVVRGGIASGEFRPVDAREAAFVLHGVLHGYLLGSQAMGRSYDTDRTVSLILDLIGGGLFSRAEGLDDG